jgi:hypothetical protein
MHGTNEVRAGQRRQVRESKSNRKNAVDAHKIEIFRREHGGMGFPHFRTLGPNECAAIRRQLTRVLGPCSDELDLTLRVAGLRKYISHVIATDAAFRLDEVVLGLGVTPDPYVYVNWFRFDQIDHIRFVDLASNLDGIWYPGADDIDVFDSTFRWIVSIAEDGTTALITLVPNPS